LLNEAYSDDQPVEELLRKHRVLALGRAPLGIRLRLMRRIGDLDSRNPAWVDDIRSFERAYFHQLGRQVDELIQQQNETALVAMPDEMKETKWLTPPPADVVDKVGKIARRIGDGRAMQTLRSLEPKLIEAVNSLDVAAARALRDQWQRAAGGQRP